MKKSMIISRRNMIKAAGVSFLFPFSLSSGTESTFLSDIGVCKSIKNHELVKKSGCTYVEDGCKRILIPDKPDDEFEKGYKIWKESGFTIHACNGFLPKTLKAVGPEIHHKEILKYAETAFIRAKKLGVKTIVFGSGGSRRIPNGFDKKKAEEQFIDLLKNMAPSAKANGIVISVEILNYKEVNFINLLSEAAAIIEAVNHPNVMICVDVFHMLRNDDPPEEILKYGKYIYHTHIAEKEKRTPPGTKGDDFRPYLKALKEVGYKGKMSIECKWKDIEKQLPLAVKELKKQISEV